MAELMTRGLLIDDFAFAESRTARQLYGTEILPAWWDTVHSARCGYERLVELEHALDGTKELLVVVDRYLPSSCAGIARPSAIDSRSSDGVASSLWEKIRELRASHPNRVRVALVSSHAEGSSHREWKMRGWDGANALKEMADRSQRERRTAFRTRTMGALFQQLLRISEQLRTSGPPMLVAGSEFNRALGAWSPGRRVERAIACQRCREVVWSAPTELLGGPRGTWPAPSHALVASGLPWEHIVCTDTDDFLGAAADFLRVHDDGRGFAAEFTNRVEAVERRYRQCPTDQLGETLFKVAQSTRPPSLLALGVTPAEDELIASICRELSIEVSSVVVSPKDGAARDVYSALDVVHQAVGSYSTAQRTGELVAITDKNEWLASWQKVRTAPPADKGTALELFAESVFSSAYEVERNLNLTGREFDLLCELGPNPPQAFSKYPQVVVECKNLKGKVGAQVIFAILGKAVFSRASLAVLIAPAGISGPADRVLQRASEVVGVDVVVLTAKEIERFLNSSEPFPLWWSGMLRAAYLRSYAVYTSHRTGPSK